MNKGRVKIVLLVLVVFLVAIELVQPSRTNPPRVDSQSLQAHLSVPPQVQSIFQRACYNCHSNQTVWPWYGHVAPISWFVVDHVNDGRRHINFDNWEAQRSPQAAAENIHMMCQDVREGDMPPLYYRVVHGEAHLSDSDKNAICAWTQSAVTPAP